MGKPGTPENVQDLKLILLSAHDSTLAAILSAVGAQSKIGIKFASIINIELWKK